MKIRLLNTDKVAIIDGNSFEKIKSYRWRLSKAGNGYAVASHGTKQISMHRVILNPSQKIHIDHINGDGLDNRIENLRLCTHGQNMSNRKLHKNNTSGYKGVNWESEKWRATIYRNGKKISLGCFDDILDAAKAYNKAALKYYGEFAKLNEI
jgi:hypothetical protein